MDELHIKVKPVLKKPVRGRLPAKLGRGYPAGLPAAFMETAVLTELKAYASTQLDYELGGVLVGSAGRSTRRLFVRIERFIPATKGVSRRASFEFTNEAQQEIHEVMQAQYPSLQIVGWFHTHPGYGIFLSSADVFIDRNFFCEKYHVAMVLDPRREDVEVGLFVWDRDGERVRVPLIQL